MTARWQSKPFEDCIEKVTYTTKIQRKDFLVVGAFPVVSQEDAFINGYWDGADDVFRAETPLVIFGDHTKVLKYIDFDFVLGADGVKLLPPKEFLVPKFFYYQLQTAQLDSLGYARHYKLLKELEIKYPDRAEQHRIVAILDAAFDGIATAKANAEKNLKNARALFESHLQSVFTKRGAGWVEATIGEVCAIKHGFAFDGVDFSTDVPKGNPLVITPGNFTENGTLLFNERNTKRFNGDTPVGYQFNVGDLVVVMTDLSSKMKILGKPAFVETDDVLHNQRIGRVVFSNDRVEKRLLYYFMMTEVFLKNIKGSATGTMVKHTAPKRIMSNVIPFPGNRDDQRAIISRLDDLRAETQHLESLYQQKLTALDNLKKSLLHQAFSGAL
ncbi:MAG: restriction endonuclease subunit S [Sulfuricellaceae bacterium]|nr:restriction endonuclease subunit S [Sulfuricellaceae bacterium]